MKTPAGTIVLENLPPDADVLVDGETVAVTRDGDRATVSVNRDGPHGLKVVLGGQPIYSSDLTVVGGGEPVRLRVERPVPAAAPPPPADAPNGARPPPPAPAPATDGFVPLFDGKSLAGWKANWDPNNNRRLWAVEDGVITNDGKNATELVWTRAEYGDFHLRVEARSSEGAKSAAVLFRRVEVDRDVAYYRAGLGGPLQAPGGLAFRPSGGPITPVQGPAPVLPSNPGRWSVYDLVAKGDRITISVDGRQVVDYTETGVTPRAGSIALYAHSGAKVWVRKVEIRERPAVGPE